MLKWMKWVWWFSKSVFRECSKWVKAFSKSVFRDFKKFVRKYSNFLGGTFKNLIRDGWKSVRKTKTFSLYLLLYDDLYFFIQISHSHGHSRTLYYKSRRIFIERKKKVQRGWVIFHNNSKVYQFYLYPFNHYSHKKKRMRWNIFFML